MAAGPDAVAAARLIILGASGNTADILDMVRDINDAAGQAVWEPLCVLDDGRAVGDSVHGLPVAGGIADAGRFAGARFVNGIGSTNTHRIRDRILARAGLSGDVFATLVHPRATIFASARLGAGVVLYPGVVVGSGARLGDHVLVLANSVINHDCQVGDHACLASGVLLSGGVHVGARAYVGAGANILPGVAVRAGALVGAGAVVTRPVAADAVVAGVPARVLRNLPPLP